ncbi:MAG TPA: nucleotidyl transferase AbiEii/AbiGii toxin family protein [Pyrinomonadaceae bacterium]|nr:nucleotidyl transferase AbiEii/AbiGii toxin family protein [Pyrinomonadaceae bacterium]
MISTELNELQKEFLARFFARESSFYLTGGAALVGYYLHHRQTQDLDLFTLKSDIEHGAAIVNEVAREMTAMVEPLQTSPDFRRILLRRNDASIVIDLIREYVFQIDNEKRLIGGVRVDAPEEILANKLCALLSRSEIRDLVDLRAIELSGFSLEDVFANAQKKDSGLTAAQLSWVLSQIQIGEESELPANVSPGSLREYLEDLKERLVKLALPEK